MQHFKALGVISLILGFVLVTFGCATGKNQVSIMEDITISAESIPEGIQLTFSQIPPETSMLYVDFVKWEGTEEPNDAHDITHTYSLIRDGSLEQVKQTNRIIMPFVQTGYNYLISANCQNANSEEITDWVFVYFTADNGIHFINDISLSLNNTNTGVTLSTEPVFSSEVTFAPQKYEFTVSIEVTENGSLGFGTFHKPTIEGLSWVFEPEMSVDLRESVYVENGIHYPAYVTACCNIFYDNITWAVELAKTPRFAYLL